MPDRVIAQGFVFRWALPKCTIQWRGAIISLAADDGWADEWVVPHRANLAQGAGCHPASPTARRPRLAAELRAITGRRDESLQTVATGLGWSTSKLSRYELGSSLNLGEVASLLDHYQVAGVLREHLLALAQEAPRKGWWEEYSDVSSGEYRDFIGLEAEASSGPVGHVEVVTGLLPTERYARSLLAEYSRVGPIARPAMSLRSLPLRAPHPVSAESFVIFRFGPEKDAIMRDVTEAEGLKEVFYVADRQQTYLHRPRFGTLLEVALGDDTSRDLTIQHHAQLALGVRMSGLLCTSDTTTPAPFSSWTKSSESHGEGNCVEVADLPGGKVGIRHSKDIGGPVLVVAPEEWRAFLKGVKNGEFDIPRA